MASTMRAVDIKNKSGPATSLFINPDTPNPVPASGEALIKIHAFGLNRADTLQREGRYPLPPGAPTILGLEFSGTIVELPSSHSDTDFKVGDEVFGLAYGGAYAEYLALSTRALIKKPPQFTHEQCASLPEAYYTALQAIHMIGNFSAEKRESILWHAGASSVSIAGIQLIKLISPGSKVFATTRSQDKNEWLVAEYRVDGAFDATVVNSEGVETWSDKVMAANGGKGVDLIVDFVGAPYIAGNLKAAARDGRIVSLGMMGGGKIKEGTDIGMMVFKRIRWEGSTLRSRDLEYQGKLRGLFEEEVLPKVVSGQLKVVIEKVMSWDKIVEAHQLMESNKVKGKIVCTVD